MNWIRVLRSSVIWFGTSLFSRNETSAAVECIRLMPEAWTKIGEHTRRCILKGFPYALFYIIEPGEIVITAVVHLHRDPKHYKDKIV